MLQESRQLERRQRGEHLWAGKSSIVDVVRRLTCDGLLTQHMEEPRVSRAFADVIFLDGHLIGLEEVGRSAALERAHGACLPAYHSPLCSRPWTVTLQGPLSRLSVQSPYSAGCIEPVRDVERKGSVRGGLPALADQQIGAEAKVVRPVSTRQHQQAIS